MRAVLRFGLIAVIVLGAAVAKADRIRVAVQKTGTLVWELDVIKRHGIERKLDLIIDTLELASTEAGKVALKGGSVDLILSDWLWVARERSLGDTLVFYPASTALGAVMTPAQSSIRSVLDLKDKKLAIAGGPLDKSWLLLQAFALRAGIDLRKQAVIVYGAPPLLSQKALQGETDATLTYWNFCAAREQRVQPCDCDGKRHTWPRGEGAARDRRLRLRRQLGQPQYLHCRAISRGSTSSKRSLGRVRNGMATARAETPPE